MHMYQTESVYSNPPPPPPPLPNGKILTLLELFFEQYLIFLHVKIILCLKILNIHILLNIFQISWKDNFMKNAEEIRKNGQD